MLEDDFFGAVVGIVHQPADFAINLLSGGFAVVTGARDVSSQEDIVLVFAIFDHAKGIAHSPLTNHLASQTRHLLDVARGAIGNVLTIEFFGNTTRRGHGEQIKSLLALSRVFITLGKVPGPTEKVCPRNN